MKLQEINKLHRAYRESNLKVLRNKQASDREARENITELHNHCYCVGMQQLGWGLNLAISTDT